MVKIITFEGSDYSGKTDTLMHLSKNNSKNRNLVFNEGPIYPTGLTARLMSVADQSNDQDREFLYTNLFMMDANEAKINHTEDERTIFQDKYWPSVIAYGNFLNEARTIHAHQNYKPLFLIPDSTILFSCSYEEKIKRSEKRGRLSVIDSFLLKNPEELDRLENEIEKSLEGLPNIHRIDTTNKSIEEVGSEIMTHSKKLGLLVLEEGEVVQLVLQCQ